MRVLVVTNTGFGSGLTHFISEEGHSVTTTAQDVTSYNYDIAFFDSTSHYKVADDYRTKGIKVLGPSVWSHILETDVTYRDNLIKAIGYNTPPDNLATAPGGWVIGWFNGNTFISKSFVLNYEHMMPGDVGVKVESAGYVSYFDVEKSRIVNDILGPLERFLRKANHRGCFSINVVWDAKANLYVRDISPSCSKPYAQAIYENSRRSKSDILLDVFNAASQPVPYIDPYVCGVMLSVYPYPFTCAPQAYPINGLNTYNMKHMWVIDITSSGQTYSGGGRSGCIGYVVARGVSPMEARRRVYRTISNLKVPDLQYRNDIGQEINETFFKLKESKLL